LAIVRPAIPSLLHIHPLGDRAILVEFGSAIDEPTRLLVRASYEQLCSRPLAGVVDIVPAFASIAVHYDPAQLATSRGATAHAAIASAIEQVLRTTVAMTAGESRLTEIPVCYHPSVAPDIEEVATHAGLTTDQVVELHTAPDYVVHMIGFLPGFPYLGGLDARLTTPRRSTPRTHVPAGSVGIGGSQTGVYSIDSPGGWQLIGRTATRLFDVERNPPVLLKLGDRVRFRAITIEEHRAARNA
jgi:inhibitor of KinA